MNPLDVYRYDSSTNTPPFHSSRNPPLTCTSLSPLSHPAFFSLPCLLRLAAGKAYELSLRAPLSHIPPRPHSHPAFFSLPCLLRLTAGKAYELSLRAVGVQSSLRRCDEENQRGVAFITGQSGRRCSIPFSLLLIYHSIIYPSPTPSPPHLPPYHPTSPSSQKLAKIILPPYLYLTSPSTTHLLPHHLPISSSSTTLLLHHRN